MFLVLVACCKWDVGATESLRSHHKLGVTIDTQELLVCGHICGIYVRSDHLHLDLLYNNNGIVSGQIAKWMQVWWGC